MIKRLQTLLWLVLAALSLQTVTAQDATAVADTDTAALTLTPQPEISHFTRFGNEMTKMTFIPKGQWIAGVSVGYSQSHQKNYTFLVLENLNGDTYSFNVSPKLLYAFKDNLAVGGRFTYKRSRSQLDSGKFNLGEDTNYDIENLYNITHNYSMSALLRNYLPLGRTLRFGFFNEVALQIGGGQSKIINGRGANLTGTYSRNFNIGIGLQPGMVVFLNNYSAIEVNVGVLGFEYTHQKMTTDQVYVADLKMKSANFRINLFSITFGAVFYL